MFFKNYSINYFKLASRILKTTSTVPNTVHFVALKIDISSHNKKAAGVNVCHRNPKLVELIFKYMCVIIRRIKRSIFGDQAFLLQKITNSTFRLWPTGNNYFLE